MSLTLQKKNKPKELLKFIFFFSILVSTLGCSNESETNIEATKIPVPVIQNIEKEISEEKNMPPKIIIATVNIDSIVETVIAKIPTPEKNEITPTQKNPDVEATALSVIDSILSLTPTLTPFPTSTPTPIPTLTPTPTFTPTPTLIPSIITVYSGSTIVSQSGTQITINDATAFSSRNNDGLTVDIFWGDGTSMENISVKDDGSITAKHTYTKAGIFPVKFIVTNKHGVSVSDEINYVINEDN